MNEIKCYINKVLRLEKVLSVKIDIEKEESGCDIQVERMINYLNLKGAKQVGPLIQYLKSKADNVEMYYMIQSNKYFEDVDVPYSSEEILKISNCIFAHYKGPGDKMNCVYEKIHVVAFENDLVLSGECYTVYIDLSDDVVVDVFMPVESRQ